jgi:MFS family permease
MPTYQQIGFVAPAILVLVRLIQGFGVGGEQGGAVLLTSEAAPPTRRGFFASFVQLGSPVAYLVPTSLFAVLSNSLSEEAFLSWGWRVPFWISLLVIVVGLYIRVKVPESETFRKAKASHSLAKHPFRTLFANNRRELIGGFFAKWVEAAAFPFYTAFLLFYGQHIGVDKQLVLDAIIIAIVAEIIMLTIWGFVTDKVGRRPVFLGCAILNLVLIVPGFLAIQTGNLAVIAALLIAGLALGHAGTYAPQASFFPELFPSKARYSGVSLVWQFGAMVASGPFTVVATALLIAGNGSWVWVAVYTAALMIAAIIALCFLPETTPQRLGNREYADWGDVEAAEQPDDSADMADQTNPALAG